MYKFVELLIPTFNLLATCSTAALKPPYNQFHNILRLFDVLPKFSFTTSETIRDYYL